MLDKTPVRSQSLKEMFESDLAGEQEAITFYSKAFMEAAAEGDLETRSLFERIVLEEEEHSGWLELQIDLLERMSESVYISKNVPAPAQDTQS